MVQYEECTAHARVVISLDILLGMCRLEYFCIHPSPHHVMNIAKGRRFQSGMWRGRWICVCACPGRDPEQILYTLTAVEMSLAGRNRGVRNIGRLVPKVKS